MSKLSLSDESKQGKWQKGDRIGSQFEIFNILGGEGKSGMGIVYICYDHEQKIPCALKTFQEKYLVSKRAQEQFEREALVWTHLEKYPYIVHAHWVEKVSDRLFIVLEYVAPNEVGKNTLSHYMGNLSFVQTLKFAIQFCYGMEYAYSKGIDAHRDIKPDNIMITSNRMVKITDFGLVKTLSGIETGVYIESEPGNKLSIFKSQGKGICGTPPWMAPEQFDGHADKRSDIYAFGMVLYQMVSGSRLPPIIGKSFEEYKKFHQKIKVPSISSPLFKIILKCLEKAPQNRYQDFSTLKETLQLFLKKETGVRINPPEIKELSVGERSNKGKSLGTLGFYDEAIQEYRDALRIDPVDAIVHHNLGTTLKDKGFLDEAILEFREALRIDPTLAIAHVSLGSVLNAQGHLDEAILEFRKALMIDPRNVLAHFNLGTILLTKGYLDEAILEFQDALRIDSRLAAVHCNLGNALQDKGLWDEAITAYENFIKYAPLQYAGLVEKVKEIIRELRKRR